MPLVQVIERRGRAGRGKKHNVVNARNPRWFGARPSDFTSGDVESFEERDMDTLSANATC